MIGTPIRLFCSIIACFAALRLAAEPPPAVPGETKPTGTKMPPNVLFSTELPDVPGKQLVVVQLDRPPTTTHSRVDHRHPGSVYVYVVRGTYRLGIEGQPVREVHAGESFFEPPGALHTVAENASSTEPAMAIAVMIVPDGAPLSIKENEKK